MSLSKELEAIIRKESEHKKVYIQDFIDHFGSRSLIFIIAILTLPIALPFTPPGVNTPFAVVCLILIISWMQNKPDFKLPRWISSREIPFSPDGRFFKAMKSLLGLLEKIIKPRNESLINNKFSRLILGVGLLSSTIVMLIPLPIINSLSSLIVLLTAYAIISKDGLIAMLSAISGIFLLLTGLAIIAYGLYFGISFFK
jgi:hypothetical protein